MCFILWCTDVQKHNLTLLHLLDIVYDFAKYAVIKWAPPNDEHKYTVGDICKKLYFRLMFLYRYN